MKRWLAKWYLVVIFLAPLAVWGAATGFTTLQAKTAAASAVDLSGVAASEGSSLGFAKADHGHSITGILPVLNGGTAASINTSSAAYVANQTTSPGTQQTGNLNISGAVEAMSLGIGTNAAIADMVTIKLGAADHVMIDASTNPQTTAQGALHVDATAGANSMSSLYLSMNSGTYSDSRNISTYMDVGTFAAGSEASVINTGVDINGSAGGRVSALRVAELGTGSAHVTALEADQGVAPLLQNAAATTNAPTKAYSYNGAFTDITAALASAVTNVGIFTANSDYVYIGYSSKFTAINISLLTKASGAGIKPAFAFSTGVATFSSFVPSDGTLGMRSDGIIDWQAAALSGWAVGTVNGTASTYWIRIQRTQNTLSSTPVELGGVVAVTTPYSWDETGAVSAASLALGTPLPYGSGGTGASALTNHGVVTAGASALTTVAPGTSGNVLTSNGTDWASSAPGAGAGWVTAYNVDWTALSTLNLKTAGDVAQDIGDGLGVAWTPVNSSTSTTLRITNGTGLVLVNNTGGYTQLKTPLTTIAPNAWVGDQELQYWVRGTITGTLASGKQAGSEVVTTAASTQFQVAMLRLNNTGTQSWQTYVSWNGSGGAIDDKTTDSTGHDVMMTWFSNHGKTWTVYTGTWTGGASTTGWPAVSAMRTRYTYTTADSSADASAKYTNAVVDVYISDTTRTYTVTNIRIRTRG